MTGDVDRSVRGRAPLPVRVASGRIVAGIAGITFVGLALAAIRGRRGRGKWAGDPAARSRPDPGHRCRRLGDHGRVLGGRRLSPRPASTPTAAAPPRYLLSVVPLVSALVARTVAELAWPRVALGAVIGAQLAMIAAQFAQYDGLVGNPDFAAAAVRRADRGPGRPTCCAGARRGRRRRAGGPPGGRLAASVRRRGRERR